MRMRVCQVAFITALPTQETPDNLETLIVDFTIQTKKYLYIPVWVFVFDTTKALIVAVYQDRIFAIQLSDQSYIRYFIPESYPREQKNKYKYIRAFNCINLSNIIEIKSNSLNHDVDLQIPCKMLSCLIPTSVIPASTNSKYRYRDNCGR